MFIKIFSPGNLKKLLLKTTLVGLVITISITGFGQSGNSCSTTALPSFRFPSNSLNLTADAKALLATIAELMKSKPTCSITITSFSSISKSGQAICNKRLDGVKRYLSETGGILGSRIMTDCLVIGGGKVGNVNTVDVRWDY